MFQVISTSLNAISDNNNLRNNLYLGINLKQATVHFQKPSVVYHLKEKKGGLTIAQCTGQNSGN